MRRLRRAGRRARGARALRHRSRWPSCARRRPRSRAPACEVNAQQAYLFEILSPITEHYARSRARCSCPTGARARSGEVHRDPALADALERFGAEGPAPFYTGDVAAAVVDWVRERGGTLTREDLAAYEAIPREPVRVAYRGREVLTNPPPSAGGTLLAYALALLERARRAPPDARRARRARWSARSPSARRRSWRGSPSPASSSRFMASRLGSTTHISVMDEAGWACAVTCTNGEGSGIVVPGTGIHVNNMMGEQDLSPLGFFTHPPGRRLPSMMAPTVVLARRASRSSCSAPRAPTGSARRCCR